MVLSRAVLRALAGGFAAAVAVIWLVAWFAPGLGLQYDDGAYLVAARALARGQGYVTANLPVPVAQTGFPPLFPILLALWSLISLAPAWLKALPVACSAAWFLVTWKLLRRMGATAGGAALIVGITAAAPGVISRGANLFADPLFAALIAASLVLLLDGRLSLSGLATGLATLTRIAGIPVAAACIVTLIARRRFRDALLFTAPAIPLIAPWFGWALAHGAHEPGSGINTYSAANIFTALEPGDKLIVILRNLEWLFAAPFEALSGGISPVAAGATAVLLIGCVIRSRQLIPDLVVLLYAAMLLCRAWPPGRDIAPVLPLVLWMVWRAAATIQSREPVIALFILLAGVPLWQDSRRIPDARRTGEFTAANPPAERHADLRKFFSAIRRRTRDADVLAANLDPLFYFETGRKTIRGYDPSGFDLYYSPRPFVLPPDQFHLALMRNGVSYFALTPGDITASGAPLHAAAQALERGGVLEYVPVQGLPPGYALLRVYGR